MNHLKNLGISGIAKVKASQEDNADIVKGFCEDKETRLKLLKKGLIEFEPEDSIYRFAIEVKPLLWAPERCTKCNKFKHLHGATACTVEICGKCMEEGHKGKDCTAHPTRFKCVNCGESKQII